MSSKRNKVLIIVLIVLLLVAVGLVLDGFYCNNHIDVTTYDVVADIKGDLRIVQISDLHNSELGASDGKLINTVKELEPDIIVITGDLIDSDHTDIDLALEFVSQAVDIAPCYYVTGNHEYWYGDFSRLSDGMNDLGVTILNNNTSDDLSEYGIVLAGVDDPAGNLDFDGSVIAASDNGKNYTILLSHRPECFDKYVSAGCDLVLTGHAHGGQFRLPIIGGLVAPDQGLFPKYDAGLYFSGNSKMIVSRGIGNSVIPLRINNCAEVVVVNLEGR